MTNKYDGNRCLEKKINIRNNLLNPVLTTGEERGIGISSA